MLIRGSEETFNPQVKDDNKDEVYKDGEAVSYGKGDLSIIYDLILRDKPASMEEKIQIISRRQLGRQVLSKYVHYKPGFVTNKSCRIFAIIQRIMKETRHQPIYVKDHYIRLNAFANL